MENEIGEYGRTNFGRIIDKFAFLTNQNGEIKTDKVILIKDNKLTRDFYYFEKGEYMIKHSPNLIDLIEYGDLVKFKGLVSVKGIDVIDMRTNEKVSLVFPDAEFCDGWTDNCMIYDLDYLVEKDQSNKIDWVLTHEQIKQNCYKAKE